VGDVLKFTGEVRFKSMLRIDGHFLRQVTSSDGTLIVSSGAQVTQAVINVAVAKINGTVEGDIHASKELVLGRTASVTGQVTSPALIVEEGALFNGTCRRTYPRKLNFIQAQSFAQSELICADWDSSAETSSWNGQVSDKSSLVSCRLGRVHYRAV